MIFLYKIVLYIYNLLFVSIYENNKITKLEIEINDLKNKNKKNMITIIRLNKYINDNDTYNTSLINKKKLLIEIINKLDKSNNESNKMNKNLIIKINELNKKYLCSICHFPCRPMYCIDCIDYI